MADTITVFEWDYMMEASEKPGEITRELRQQAAWFRDWNRRNRRAIDSYDRRMAFICPEPIIEHAA
jgi:hypothetical protein